jgi:hypothetical protein
LLEAVPDLLLLEELPELLGEVLQVVGFEFDSHLGNAAVEMLEVAV